MALENQNPLARLTLYVVGLCCVALLVWAHFAVLDEVTIGVGKVVASSQMQVIQNMEGGILSKLHVREGDSVKAGQPLLRIDDTRFISSYREGQASIAALQRSLDSVMQELEMNQPLLEKGAVTEVELLRLRRQASELQGQIDERRATSIAAQDRLVRSIVRAPINGIVKRIMVTTTGGVIQPGEKIMEIVPADDHLLVEVKIRPSDIAFIRPGQQAMVKISAYDYSVYGGIKGTVEQISADAIDEDRKDESYYKVQVRTERNYLGESAKHLPIIPGMTATAEVMTGKKSILDYLLKPLLKVQQNAMRER